MFAAGVVTGRPNLRRSGERVLASLALAGVTTLAMKRAVGRLRPNAVHGSVRFQTFLTERRLPVWPRDDGVRAGGVAVGGDPQSLGERGALRRPLRVRRGHA